MKGGPLRALKGSLWRAANDNWSVYLLRKGADPSTADRVPTGPLGYLADPFLATSGGETWLLAERFDYLKRRGRLVAAPLDDLRRVHGLKLRTDLHASFPFVFTFQGETYLLPETSQARRLDLYRLTGSPPRADFVHEVMQDRDFVDSVIFEHDGLWWLVSLVGGEDNRRALEIHYAETPLSRRWLPHPVNGRRLFAGAPHGTGRNAGSIVRDEGRLLMPIQTNPTYYGEVVVYIEIVRLTPTEFRVRTVEDVRPGTETAFRTSTHHVAQADGWIAYDRREPTRFAPLLERFDRIPTYRQDGTTAADRALVGGLLEDALVPVEGA